MARRKKGKGRHRSRQRKDKSKKQRKSSWRGEPKKGSKQKSKPDADRYYRERTASSSEDKLRSRRRRNDIYFVSFIIILAISMFIGYYLYYLHGGSDDGVSGDSDIIPNNQNSGNGGGGTGTNIGQTAPNFVLTDTDGGKFSLNEYRGNVVILDFMATWCSPCVTEMDHLKDVRSNYYSRGIRILSIDVDDSETANKLDDFKKEHNCPWRFAVGGGSAATTYGASNIPTLYIIDSNGKITYKSTGLTSYSVLSSELNKIV